MCIPKYTDNKLKIGDVVRYYNSRYGYGIIYEIKETHISAFFSGINGDTWTFKKITIILKKRSFLQHMKFLFYLEIGFGKMTHILIIFVLLYSNHI